jgi:phosphoglycolate phosphatase-like HAD superfamily hydrolase
MRTIRTVLFDLDGTLLDTAPDLADALNAVLMEHHRPPLPFQEIRGVVSHGAMALIRLGFDLDESHPDFQPLRRRLLAFYRDNLSRKTRPFPGMDELLDQLETQGYNWGVVTNKPGCVYVGDAERDVEAGRNAGMHTLVALFGYFQTHDRPQEWHADGMIQAPSDLLAWLTQLNGSG